MMQATRWKPGKRKDKILRYDGSMDGEKRMDTIQKSELEKRIDVASGLLEADLVLKGGQVFNVFTGAWERADIAVCGDKIAGIGSYAGKKELDVTGLYLTPGLMDAHVHFESSMLAPREMVKILLLNGVTGAVADPHEITNVMGISGLQFMLRETEDIPFSVYVMVPSCVPATDLDTSGASLPAEEMDAVCRLSSRVLGLAEMMNVPGVLYKQPVEMSKLKLFSGKTIDGHSPGLSGKLLNAYIASGVTTEHECVTPEEALEKVSRGMYVFLREGSAAHNLIDLLPVLEQADTRRFCLCTDDRHADDLIEKGSINYALEIGVIQGYAAEKLIPLATLNTAECYGLRNVGALAPGYTADIAAFGDLQSFQPVHVVKNGRIVVQNKKLLWDNVPVAEVPESTMRMEELTAEQLRIPAREGKQIRVIEINPSQLLTKELRRTPLMREGEAVSDTERDILKMAVCERHHATGNIGLGFVTGFGLQRGAIATTVGHDSHNLAIVGTNDGDMVLAANRLRALGGGLAIAADGEVKAILPLAIGGLMSDQPAEAVNAQIKKLDFWLKELGVPEDCSTFMILSFLSLPVIPELRLTDRGLVDVGQFCHVELWCDGKNN